MSSQSIKFWSVAANKMGGDEDMMVILKNGAKKEEKEPLDMSLYIKETAEDLIS
jgi:hypothetical protein